MPRLPRVMTGRTRSLPVPDVSADRMPPEETPAAGGGRVAAVASALVELAGLGCLVAAAWWWLPVVGLVSLGVVLVYVAQAFG